MGRPIPVLKTSDHPRAAIFVSGGGTNAEKILERQAGFEPAAMVTDRPNSSRAADIANAYDLPLVALDIKAFYAERGEKRVSLMTPRGRDIREEWTNALRQALQPYQIDFGVLAGFIPLTNITGDFPCLNVHPGDLTVERDGKRLLVGLHTIPIETAILNGYNTLRSSVILAQPYTGSGGEMDSGPILGVSTPVPVDLMGRVESDLRQAKANRPEKKPKGGFGDILEDIAKANQEQLKEDGDWVVFPAVVNAFAQGRYALDDADGGLLYYEEGNDQPIAVQTIEYGVDSVPRLML